MQTKFPVNKVLIIIVAAVVSFGLGWAGGELLIKFGYLPLKPPQAESPPPQAPAPVAEPEVAKPPPLDTAPPVTAPPVSAPPEKPSPLPVTEAPKPTVPTPEPPLVAAKPTTPEPAAVAPPPPPAPEAKAPEPEAAPPPAPEPEPVKAKAPEPTPFRLDVLNGMGKKGFAQEMRRLLVKKGYQVVAIGDFKDFEVETTEIRYRAKHKQAAQDLKAEVFPTALVKPS